MNTSRNVGKEMLCTFGDILFRRNDYAEVTQTDN